MFLEYLFLARCVVRWATRRAKPGGSSWSFPALCTRGACVEVLVWQATDLSGVPVAVQALLSVEPSGAHPLRVSSKGGVGIIGKETVVRGSTCLDAKAAEWDSVEWCGGSKWRWEWMPESGRDSEIGLVEGSSRKKGAAREAGRGALGPGQGVVRPECVPRALTTVLFPAVSADCHRRRGAHSQLDTATRGEASVKERGQGWSRGKQWLMGRGKSLKKRRAGVLVRGRQWLPRERELGSALGATPPVRNASCRVCFDQGGRVTASCLGKPSLTREGWEGETPDSRGAVLPAKGS